MEAPNPLFDQSKTSRRVESLKEAESPKRMSTKGLQIPAETTLNKEDWDMIEDDLLPFEITAILISLGGVALIGITIHALTGEAVKLEVALAMLGGLGGSGVLLLLLVVPCVVGTIQILLAIFFSMLAAAEQWKHVSCQDVIVQNLPAKLEHYARRIPLKCTGRKLYLALMWIFLIIQIIASGVAYGLNSYIDQATNQGSDAASSGGLIRDILDYSSVVFNSCCAAKGWSKQGFIPQCAAGTSELTNCTVPSELSNLQNKICACYLSSSSLVSQYERYVNDSGLCNTMNKGTAFIPPGQKIPGTSISIRTLVPPSITSIPLVGDMNTEYGCGTGFLRGYQWAISEFATTSLNPYFIAMLVISGLQLLFLLIGSTVVCRIRLITDGPTTIGEDGNIQYGVSSPLQIQRGLRGLFSNDVNVNGSLFSPKLVGASFRRRSRSRSGVGKTPSPMMSALGPVNDLDLNTIGSPDIMRSAAKHSSQQEDVDRLRLEQVAGKTATGIDSIL